MVKAVPRSNDFRRRLRRRWCEAENNSRILSRLELQRKMSRSWTIGLSAAVPKICEEGKSASLTSGKNASHTVRRIYNVGRRQRVDVLSKYGASRLSSPRRTATQRPLGFSFEWGELLMTRPALCESSRSRGSKQDIQKKMAPSRSAHLPCLSKCED